MKRILIVGAMNKLMTNLNDMLVEDFQVQICALDAELMKNMIKIVKPDMIIFCLVGVYDVRKDLFVAVEETDTSIPVLVLERDYVNEVYPEYYQKEQFDSVTCPLKRSELLSKCCVMLGEERADYKEDEMSDLILSEQEQKHILVVDDSPMLLRSIKSMLEKEYKVSVATSGEQALKFVPNKKPDLIFLDYDMPGMNGKETFERLKQDEVGKDIPVIFLTGVTSKQEIYAVLQLGPAGYILKPPSAEKLTEAVEKIFNA